MSGRWQWGSGAKHCTTIGGGCLVVGARGQPEPRADGLAMPFVFMDPGDVDLIETWDVAGLCGTGSVDYVVHDVLVPEGRWVEIGADGPVRDNVWSRFSFFGLPASGVAAAAAGIARRSIDELVALAASRKPQGSSRTLAERAQYRPRPPTRRQGCRQPVYEDEAREVCGIPDRYEVAAMLPLGVPLGKWGVARRRPAESLTSWNRFGNRRPAIED